MRPRCSGTPVVSLSVAVMSVAVALVSVPVVSLTVAVVLQFAAEAVRATNKYITDKEPWKMKNDIPGRTKVPAVAHPRLQRTLHTHTSTCTMACGAPDTATLGTQVVKSTLEAVYVVAHFMAPFIPNATDAIFSRLNTPQRNITQLRSPFPQMCAANMHR